MDLSLAIFPVNTPILPILLYAVVPHLFPKKALHISYLPPNISAIITLYLLSFI